MDERLVTEWACDFCGERGRYMGPDTVDALQCPTCGEPVTHVAEYWVPLEP